MIAIDLLDKYRRTYDFSKIHCNHDGFSLKVALMEFARSSDYSAGLEPLLERAVLGRSLTLGP